MDISSVADAGGAETSSAAAADSGSSAGVSSGSAAVSSSLDTGGGILATWLANQESNASAQQARSWQEQMSSTSYQRTVADMKAAGLNPDLAVMGPGQSNVPSAQAAPVQKYDFGAAGKYWDNMQQQAGVNSAQASAAASVANAKNTLESINTQRTQQTMNSAAAAESLARKDLVNSQRNVADLNGMALAIQQPYLEPGAKADLLKAQAAAASAVAQKTVDQAEASIYQAPVVGGILPWADKIGNLIQKWIPHLNFNTFNRK